jgi:hypothetical protein
MALAIAGACLSFEPELAFGAIDSMEHRSRGVGPADREHHTGSAASAAPITAIRCPWNGKAVPAGPSAPFAPTHSTMCTNGPLSGQYKNVSGAGDHATSTKTASCITFMGNIMVPDNGVYPRCQIILNAIGSLANTCFDLTPRPVCSGGRWISGSRLMGGLCPIGQTLAATKVPCPFGSLANVCYVIACR